jgi:hypothetical protein
VGLTVTWKWCESHAGKETAAGFKN